MSVWYDTVVAAQLLDEQQPASLLNQAAQRLGVEDWGKGKQQFGTAEVEDTRELLTIKGKTGLGPLFGDDNLGYYCARDTAYTHMLYEKTRGDLSADGASARIMKKLMVPGLELFQQIERNGIHVHWDLVEARDKIMMNRADVATEELHQRWIDPELAEEWREKARDNAKKGEPPKPILQNDGFLRAWFFTDERGLRLNPVVYTTAKKEPKVDEKSLNALTHEAALELIAVKKLRKSHQFFESWREWMATDLRLHPYFNPTGTVTGRRSCQNPNLQQVPRLKMMRTCIGAPEGKVFLEVDFAQMEVRLAAWEAMCIPLIELFNNGEDPYIATAASILDKLPKDVTKDERQKAKASVLGFLYGMLAKSFVSYAWDMYGVEFTIKEAEQFRDGFFAMYPELVHWHERRRRQAQRGYVSSLVGRKRHLDDINSINNMTRWGAERQAINAPIQGMGGDWTLGGMLSLPDLGEGNLIVGDIHDAVLFELNEDTWRETARIIMEAMERPSLLMNDFNLEPPLRLVAEGSVGHSWGYGNEFTLETLDEVEVRDWVPVEIAV